MAEEPLSRPFTAIGIRPKTGQLTPTSAGATRPRTALQSFARERTSISIARDVTPPQTEYSSQLTAGAVLQDRLKSFYGTSIQTTFNGHSSFSGHVIAALENPLKEELKDFEKFEIAY